MSNRMSGAMTATPLQKAALAVGAVFALVGVLGFVPGITTNYGDLELAGHESGAQLLGLFEVSILHNVVHLLFGAAAFPLARTWEGARAYLVGGGGLYLLLALYGALIDRNTAANFLPVDIADNWLHVVLGVGMVALGVVLSRGRETVGRRV